MPQLGTELGDTGKVVKVYRMPGHAVDIGEPLVDVRVGMHTLTVCHEETVSLAA